MLPDTYLSINRPADIFDEDLSTGEYSLPIEIPWTENNKLLFGFSERLENYIPNKVNSWLCDVLADGYPEMLNASINLLNKAGKISYSTGKFTANISSFKGQFGNDVKGKKLQDLNYGPNITWTDYESREFATRHAKGLYPDLSFLSFSPLVIQEYFNTEKNYFGEFLAQDTVNNLISTGAGENNWLFGRPISDTPTIATTPGHIEHVDYRTIPFFKARYILQKVMTSLGYNISGTVLDNPVLDFLYIFNTYSLEDYDFSLKVDKNRKIIIANHLPDMLVVDFLKSIFTFLNSYSGFKGGKQIELRDRNKFIKTRKIFDVSAYLIEDFSSEFIPLEEQGGYQLDYEKDNDDGYFSEAVREIEDKILAGTVNTRDELGTMNIGTQLTTEHIAFVKAENMYYVVADATAIPIVWSAYSDNLLPLKSGNGNKTVTVGAGTLATYIELDDNTGIYRRLNKLASRQPGCYINNKSVLVRNPFTLRFFYIKQQNIGGNVYPVSFNHNTTNNGITITDYSLALNIENSVGSMHKFWQDANTHPEKCTLSLAANRQLLEELSDNTMIVANNVVLVPSSMDFTLPLGSEIKVSGVPL